MTTRTPSGGGQRPACPECPALQPHAIRHAAPPRPRGLSLLASCLVYTILGGIVSALPATRVAAQQPFTRRERVIERVQPPHVDISLPRPEPPARAAVGTRPADWRPPVETADVTATPTELPRVSRAFDSLYRSDMPLGKGDLLVTDPGAFRSPGAPQAGVSPDTVVDVAYESIRVLQQVAPAYPPLCRRLNIQGAVELLLTVDPGGVPRKIQAISAPHPGLELAAIQAAEQWRFEPARVGHQAVHARFHLTIHFRLTR